MLEDSFTISGWLNYEDLSSSVMQQSCNRSPAIPLSVPFPVLYSILYFNPVFQSHSQLYGTAGIRYLSDTLPNFAGSNVWFLCSWGRFILVSPPIAILIYVSVSRHHRRHTSLSHLHADASFVRLVHVLIDSNEYRCMLLEQILW